ncbi:hypothetical protein [Flavobacterium ajazii]|uniref:hypothetical protein n=1 Tax=Flavobacterium ajazii TaxID=2692318 RepID=UPI0013CF67CB|nr:hypothetical protein [Flavobacterium ajazii]
MSDLFPVNRVEADLTHWQSKEARLNKLFPSIDSVNRSFIKEKLSYYDSIAAKYKGTNNTDERFTLRIVKNERKRISKHLYPNLLDRLIRNFVKAFITEPIMIRSFSKDLERNNQVLHDQLRQIGFQAAGSKVERLMKEGQDQFIVPISNYINKRERLDFELNFSKNERGQYQFEGYRATLKDELKPNESRQHYFKNDQVNNLNLDQTYNLLSGRVIQKENGWVQFDLNDKDSNDCYRLKEFYSSYGYNIEKEIKNLPLRELRSIAETSKLVASLKQGCLQAVAVIKNGTEHKFYIEANPQFKSINIYDENFKKQHLGNVLGVKNIKAENRLVNNNDDNKIKVSNPRKMHISK